MIRFSLSVLSLSVRKPTFIVSPLGPDIFITVYPHYGYLLPLQAASEIAQTKQYLPQRAREEKNAKVAT